MLQLNSFKSLNVYSDHYPTSEEVEIFKNKHRSLKWLVIYPATKW